MIRHYDSSCMEQVRRAAQSQPASPTESMREAPAAVALLINLTTNAGL